MGLDMYLYKKTYVGNKYRQDDERVKVIVPKKQEKATFPIKNKIKSSRITEISEQVAYWRKANAIHQWFVDNVQNGNDDCGEYHVPKQKLLDLLLLVNVVLQFPDSAREKLPTQPGFFFGDYEYNDWYFEILKDTKKMLEEILEEDGDNDVGISFYYSSSW
jgi:hypothetical protein